MPQLDPFVFAPQIVWLAICFLLLYLIMSRFALPRVGAILEERQNRISGDLAEAARLREETAKAIASYEQALAEAKQRAQAIAGQTRQQVAADIEAQRAAMNQQLAEKTAEADRRIGAFRETAVAHVGDIAKEVAQAVVAQLIGKSPNDTALQGAIKEALGK